MSAPMMLGTAELARQVTALYRQVAQQPTAAFHVLLGRLSPSGWATRPVCSTRSPRRRSPRSPGSATPSTSSGSPPLRGCRDLGSGWGTDSFAAARLVGLTGHVTGIETAALQIDTLREVPEYEFLTARAQNARRRYGVRAVTLAADKI